MIVYATSVLLLAAAALTFSSALIHPAPAAMSAAPITTLATIAENGGADFGLF
jgi:hypothetical protein